jgi:hypothetical protein
MSGCQFHHYQVTKQPSTMNTFKNLHFVIIPVLIVTFPLFGLAQATGKSDNAKTACSEPGPSHIANDGTNYYWTDYNAGTVIKAPISGGSTTVLASHQAGPCGIVVIKDAVFWSNIDGGTIMTVSVNGGEPTALASNQHHPSAITANAKNLYWTTDNDVVKSPIKGGPPVHVAANDIRAMATPMKASGGTVHCDLCPVYCTRTVFGNDGRTHEESYICQWYSCNCTDGAGH